MLLRFWRSLRPVRGVLFQRSHRRLQPSVRRRIERLENRGVPAVNVLGNLTGISNTGWSPPDTGVAAGPNYVVETVNARLGIFDKGTGALVSSQNLSSLFSGFYMGSLGPFDPQVMYDEGAGRFVIAAPTTSSTSTGPYT